MQIFKYFLAAQEDILLLDVLVCGKCQNVYHFIEAFNEHKNSNECNKELRVFKTEPTVSIFNFCLTFFFSFSEVHNFLQF